MATSSAPSQLKSVQSLPVSPTKAPIDLHVALLSTLRAWLAARDAVLSCFCAGPDEDRLLPIDLSSAQPDVDQMNRLLDAAKHIANQLSDRRTPQIVVLEDALNEILSSESPKFSLVVDNLPGSF